MKLKFIWLAALLLLAHTLFAQEYRGTVQGVVTDPSDAAIGGAKVTLENVASGVAQNKATDSAGRFLFEFVLPGTYRLTAEATGFNRFVQENIAVLTRGDVTVNVPMKVGAISDSITVHEGVAAVEFNTSTMASTVQGTMLENIPILARDPFTLALLNPAVVNVYWDVAHRNPYYMLAANGLNIGGNTSGHNDLELDGVSLNIAARGSYNAPMDAVQEISVQQNAVDSEYGFSGGGAMSLSVKSGTNDFHGTGYYFGRDPNLNAMPNRVTREVSVVDNDIWGGTLGGPIRKNKLFNFFSYERARVNQPASNRTTVPTELERTGDFSQSRTPGGAMRIIYDPLTTQVVSGTEATRQPFPGNVVPQDRMDAAGVKAVKNMWLPNNSGIDASGVDNFRKTYGWWTKYWNFSDRVDYNISDSLRMYARFSKYQTRLDNENWGGTIAVPSDNGGVMDAMNGAWDLLWMVSPRTTIDFRYGVTYVEDDYGSTWAQVPESTWADFWPSGWYKPILGSLSSVYYPQFVFMNKGGGWSQGGAYTGYGSWWLVHGRSHNPTINVTHDFGMHHLKAGWQLRYSYDQNGFPAPGSFTFDSIDTGANHLNFQPYDSGSAYASALLGAVNGGSTAINAITDMRQQQWGLYVQDDIKLTRNITLNLGVRWERETAPAERNRKLGRYLDLTSPIPEFQTNAPVMPEAAAGVSHTYNGAWVYTDNSHPRMYDAPWNTFLPRVGIAVRIDDKTALRAGWARYAVPWLTIHPETKALPRYGFSQSSSVLSPLGGMPQTELSDPYPSNNPVLTPVGNSLGRYTNLGDSLWWWNPNAKKPINDRINISLQRQLPWKILTDTTFFMNIANNTQDNCDMCNTTATGSSYYTQVNMVDPMLIYSMQGAADDPVANPFYGLPADVFPGSLRYEQKVPLRQLLSPYPQYKDLRQLGEPGRKDRYYALQLQIQRPMANGLTFMFGYTYNRQSHSYYFNDVDEYNNKLTMLDRAWPRHNIRLGGTWELPFGKGRRFLNNLHPVLDAVIGGWATSNMYLWNAGPAIQFGDNLVVVGDPAKNVPAGHYFNPDAFVSFASPYTVRTNPWFYDGVRGPGYWNLDSTLAKYFKVTERVKLEVRLETYNTPNSFMQSQPINWLPGEYSNGTSDWLANYGREVQYTARIHF